MLVSMLASLQVGHGVYLLNIRKVVV